jgi:uncharacterized protein YdiU (UPF0061 family)
VAYWNLFCLGQAFLPLIKDEDLTVQSLETFKADYPRFMDEAFAAKLGLTETSAKDHELIESLLKVLSLEKTDFTLFWRRLSHAVARHASLSAPQAFEAVRDLFIQPQAWDAWLPAYLQRLQGTDLTVASDNMLKTNPKYVLRNHLGEQAIQQAKIGDFSMVNDLLAVLQNPFDEHPAFEAWAGFPPDWASSISISCSS